MSDPYAGIGVEDPYAGIGAVEHPAAASPPAPQGDSSFQSFSDFLKNFGSAAIRPAVKAVTGIPGMFADSATALGNIATGHVSLSGQPDAGAMQLPSVATNNLLDQYTRAPTGIGKGAEFINTVLAGTQVPSFQLPSNVPANFVAPDAATRATYAQPSTAEATVGARFTPTFIASGGGSTAGVVGSDTSAGLTPAQLRALTIGQDLGFRATPGQAAGSRALQQFEAKLESQPMTSGPFNALKVNNQIALNRQWAQAIGENSGTVDSSVLERANSRLGDVFENVRNPDRVIMADPSHTAGMLDSIDSKFEGLLPGNASVRTNPLVSRLETLTGSGAINGEQLGDLSSKLGRAAYKQMTTQGGDRELGQALYQVKDHVDDLVSQTLEPADQAAYNAARQQYRGLMQLTSRVGNVNPSTGNVSGGSLANYLQQTDRQGFLFGRNQSGPYNAARFAQAFKPIVGDSGTATRSMLTAPTDFLLSIPGSIFSRAYLSQPGQAVAMGVSRGAAQVADDPFSPLEQASRWAVTRGLPGLAGGLSTAEQ